MGPLTEGKASINGMPTVYVCENFACKAPVTDMAALKEQLATAGGGGGDALKATVPGGFGEAKVSESEVVSVLRKTGIDHSETSPSFGVVVGAMAFSAIRAGSWGSLCSSWGPSPDDLRTPRRASPRSISPVSRPRSARSRRAASRS